MTPYIFPGLHKYKINNDFFVTDSNKIIAKVSQNLNIDKNDILGKSRKREIVEARIICISVIRKKVPKMTLKRLGNIFNKDHSTVIYSLQVFSDLIDSKNIEFIKKVKSIFPNLLAEITEFKKPTF